MKKIKCLMAALLLFVLVAFFANQSLGSQKKSKKQSPDHQSIVLIFYKNPLLKQLKQSVFYTANKISYYDENMLLNEVNLNNRLKNDTIKVSTKKEFLPIDLFSNYVVYNYHFKRGDTILFTFQNNIPVVQDKMNTSYYDLNYSLEYKKRFSMRLKWNGMLSFGKDTVTANTKFKNIRTTYIQQQSFLDSLSKANKISSQIAVFIKNQNNFEFFSQAINPAFVSYFNQLPSIPDVNKIINDSTYFYNGYFHNFLIWQYLWSSELNIKHIKTGHGASLDYKQAYQISREKFPNKTLKEAMLLYCLQTIKEDEPIAIFKVYQKRFREDVSDTFYQKYLEDNSTALIDTKAGSSVLIGQSKSKKIEFNELIKSLSGNVIYVDIWASWCMPCRASMPDSHKLQNSFKEKAVSFVYLSSDQNSANWEKASKQEGLYTDKNNFLLINPKEAGIVKQYNLNTIPRYLIFNKKGKLVHENAPGPGSDELKMLINNYLKE